MPDEVTGLPRFSWKPAIGMAADGPKILPTTLSPEGTGQDLSTRTTMTSIRQFCTFRLGDFRMGVDVREVQEVLRYQEMTRVPLAPGVVRGLINLRGQIVMAIDLRRRLQLPDRPDDQLPTNVIVRTVDGAVSFLVDELCDVLEIEGSTLEPPPDTLDGFARDLIVGVHMLDSQMLLILDTDRLADLDTLPSPARSAERPSEEGRAQS
jgi:purine-binding chemotaxis protein CheW